MQLPAQGQRQKGQLRGPIGDLEYTLEMPKQDEIKGIAVVCHPHPQHQGTMNNKVVTTLTRAAREQGYLAIRFNFRGVGKSQGDYDEGRGEQQDVIAVCQWAYKSFNLPVKVLAGFSFGSAAALRVCDQVAPDKLVTVGLPAEYFSDQDLPRPAAQWQAIFGADDDVIDVAQSIERVGQLKPKPQIKVFENVGHFMHGSLTELREQVRKFI